MVPSPIHYATYFDRHYLTRGLALYRSLVRHSPPFRLWVLCLDDETYRMLDRLRLEHARLVPLAELERDDPALPSARPTRNTVEYYWTCGLAYLLHLFDRQPEIEALTYLDADLFFFGDPTPVYDELGDGSILLVEHRWAPSEPEAIKQKGTYNVGLLAFRRTAEVLTCLRRWREQCLEWCYDRVEPTRFGDQKYLEEWPARYAGVVVARHKGAGLAPWNMESYPLSYRRGKVWVDGDPLLYYHFNRLKVITRQLYDPAVWEHHQKLHPIARRHVYVPYARELRAAGERIRAAGGTVDRLDTLRFRTSRLQRLARMLRHGSFLVVTDIFAV